MSDESKATEAESADAEEAAVHKALDQMVATLNAELGSDERLVRGLAGTRHQHSSVLMLGDTDEAGGVKVKQGILIVVDVHFSEALSPDEIALTAVALEKEQSAIASVVEEPHN